MSRTSNLLLLPLILFSSAIIALLIRAKRRSLQFLQGPPSPSFLLGYEWEFSRVRKLGGLEDDWIGNYGSAFRMPGCFGEDILHVADPRALQHICHKSAYRYKKPRDIEHLLTKIFGPGILTANGATHQRQRKILNPVFSAAQIKPFAQLFASSAQSLALKWRAEIEGDAKVIDIYRFLHNMALDALGETMFEYDFDAMGGKKASELRDIMRDLFLDSRNPTELKMLRNATYRFIPTPLINLMALKKTKEDKRFDHWLKASQAVSQDLAKNKVENGGGGEKDKDFLSVLGESEWFHTGSTVIKTTVARSMETDDPSKTLVPDEALSQMATIIFAGHETTASTMNWVIYELSRNPKSQEQLFRELKNFREQTGNDGDFSAQDLDSMVYLNAVIKETLRVYPIVFEIVREAEEDDVIPLDSPVIDASGSVLREIPVTKGQRVIANIYEYNRFKSLWGEDAEEWKPERFLDKTRPTTLGVFANLMSFSAYSPQIAKANAQATLGAGVRACIGWRFAVLELQVVIAALVESFVFSPVEGVEIERLRLGVSPPVLKGKWQSGPQLPLKVALRQA
ncbi:hypothetical protein V5O48_005081 [Marasmius crinis-equi]|uniref:Cytochrome P450 n=1 Tax=Marasmius crinis-equi TaxID=585013 RepID=A0ABR3FNA3_9AGAR